MNRLGIWISHRRPNLRALHIWILVLAALSLFVTTIATADPSGKDGRKYTFRLWIVPGN